MPLVVGGGVPIGERHTRPHLWEATPSAGRSQPAGSRRGPARGADPVVLDSVPDVDKIQTPGAGMTRTPAGRPR